MPDRYLREAILRSDRFDALGDQAQLLYYRLISVVDDFGCYDGREYVIATAARPLRPYDVTEALIELHKAEMIVRYANTAKVYIALMQWGEMTRARRKFPAPPINNDRPDIKYRGPFGREMRWENPPRTDLVSVLLDANNRPVVPQPAEWRRVDSDWMPTVAARQREGSVKGSVKGSQDVVQPVPKQGRQPDGSQALAAKTTPVIVSSVPLSSVHRVIESIPVDAVVDVGPPSDHGSHQAAYGQPVGKDSPPTTPPMNGIKYKNGAWQGLSEAQRLKWQDMFAAISIPDQVDRAGAWLEAHPKEHEQIDRDNGEHAFLVRWLLREGRPVGSTGHTRAKTDA